MSQDERQNCARPVLPVTAGRRPPREGGGQLNRFTSTDRVRYWCPSLQFDVLCEERAGRVGVETSVELSCAADRVAPGGY